MRSLLPASKWCAPWCCLGCALAACLVQRNNRGALRATAMIPRARVHDEGGLAASAKARMLVNRASGVTVAAGVAPNPARSWRRSIQTVSRPRSLAGTWSWNRLWATCRIRARHGDGGERAQEIVVVGFVAAG